MKPQSEFNDLRTVTEMSWWRDELTRTPEDEWKNVKWPKWKCMVMSTCEKQLTNTESAQEVEWLGPCITLKLQILGHANIKLQPHGWDQMVIKGN